MSHSGRFISCVLCLLVNWLWMKQTMRKALNSNLSFWDPGNCLFCSTSYTFPSLPRSWIASSSHAVWHYCLALSCVHGQKQGGKREHKEALDLGPEVVRGVKGMDSEALDLIIGAEVVYLVLINHCLTPYTSSLICFSVAMGFLFP